MRFLLLLTISSFCWILNAQTVTFEDEIVDLNQDREDTRVQSVQELGNGILITYNKSLVLPGGLRYFDGNSVTELFNEPTRTTFVGGNETGALVAGTNDGTALFAVTETSLSPRKIMDVPFGGTSASLTVNGEIYFLYGSNFYRINEELTEITELADEINPGGQPVTFQTFGSYVYLATESGVYATDGTAAGTLRMVDGPAYPNPRLVESAGKLYFATISQAYAVSTDALTTAIPLFPGGAGSLPDGITNLNPTEDGVIFMANTPQHGWEVWRTEGSQGTTTVIEVISGAGDGVASPTLISPVIEGDGYFIYRGGDPINSRRIYISDGTMAGTGVLETMPSGIPVNEFWRTSPLAQLADGREVFYTDYAQFAPPMAWIYDPVADDLESVHTLPNGFRGDTNGPFIEDGYLYLNTSSSGNLTVEALSLADGSFSSVDTDNLIERRFGRIGNETLFSGDFGNQLYALDLTTLTARPIAPEEDATFTDLVVSVGEQNFALFDAPVIRKSFYQLSPESLLPVDPIPLSANSAGTVFSGLVATDSTIYYNSFNGFYRSDGTAQGVERINFASLGARELAGTVGNHSLFIDSDGKFGIIDGGLGSETTLLTLATGFTASYGEVAVSDNTFYVVRSEARTNFLSINATTAVIDTLFTMGTASTFNGLHFFSYAQEQDIYFCSPIVGRNVEIFKFNKSSNETTQTEILASVDVKRFSAPPIIKNEKIYASVENIQGEYQLISINMLTETAEIIYTFQEFNSIQSVELLDESLAILTSEFLLMPDSDGELVPVYNASSLSNMTRVANKLLFLEFSGFRITDITSKRTQKLGISASGSFLTQNVPVFSVIDSLAFFAGIDFGNEVPVGNYIYDGREDALVKVGSIMPISGNAIGLNAIYKGRFAHTGFTEQENNELHLLRPINLLTLTGSTFWDENGNGQQEPTESGVANLKVLADGGDLFTAFTDTSGNFKSYLPTEGSYSISPALNPCLEVTTSPSAFTIDSSSLSQGPPIIFGLSRVDGDAASELHLNTAALRCGFTVPAWVTVTNTGCSTVSGTVNLGLSTGVEFVDAEIAPLSVGENTIQWAVPDLEAQQTFTFLCQLKMPTEEFNGEDIPLQLSALLSDASNSEVTVDTFAYSQVLSCAIDPNDKLNYPVRTEPSQSNYTQTNETISYTIRFQNTGTDTAFTVRLEDQLDANLNWQTFKPISASHQYKVTLSPDGKLEVFFRDILLPDSLTNEPLSHGYFAYTIIPDIETEDFTPAFNTAGIYFDYNAPIITNTTLNTLVEKLDADNDGYPFWEDCEDLESSINPGAEEIPDNQIDENCDDELGTTSVNNFDASRLNLSPNPTSNTINISVDVPGTLRLELHDGNGRKIMGKEFRSSTQIDLSGLPNGIYLVHLIGPDSRYDYTTKVIKN